MITIGNQSSYSFLQSMLSVEDIVKQSKASGFQTVILTDENLHGALQFFNYAKTYGIKPILGQKLSISVFNDTYDSYVTVKNEEGYKNLLALNRDSLAETMSLDIIKKYQKGLAYTFYPKAQLHTLLASIQEIKQTIEDIYIGIHISDIAFVEDDIKPYKEIILPVYKPNYMFEEQKISLEYMQTHSVKKVERFEPYVSLDDIQKQWPKSYHAYETYLKSHIFQLELKPFGMPLIPLEQGVTATAYLRSLSEVGLKKRIKKHGIKDISTYEKRLQYELDVIIKMGFERYFLIVFDIIRYAKNKQILVGPGRGSAAGSLVAFVLGITDVDPIRFHLLFERFLNPHRITMPDIDMDFPDNKRDEVIEYAKERFGIEHVASIVTYQTFALKSALRDISKSMNLDSNRSQYLIQSIIDNRIDLLDRDMQTLLTHANHFIGIPRQTGTHAAGIIFSETSLFETIPLYKGSFSFYQTQWEAKELESLGMLKMDFLGIRNLAIISDTVEKIKHIDKDFQLLDISLEDKKTYLYMSEAKTQGIFQLESEGMRQTLKKLKPEHFEDIVVILALYRPGPMAFIDTYIERKNGKPYEVLHNAIQSILTSTYGIIVYQEQIMEIALVFAGYTLAEADLLRRGIAKKEESILMKERQNFIEKSIKNNRFKKDAEDIYDLILKFSDYGFNRSHSVSYALISYQMAYLKVNYPQFFMISLLQSVIGNEALTYLYLEELKAFGFNISSPDILRSTHQYQVIDREVIPPLTIIKSIGEKTILHMLEKRGQEPFKDFEHFKKSVIGIVSESQLEKLIFAQTCRGFGLNTKTLIEHKSFKSVEYYAYIDQVKIDILEEYPLMTLIQKEKEALGFNITYDIKTLLDACKEMHLDDLKVKKTVRVACVMDISKKIKTKQGEEMAFFNVFDGYQHIEATMFPKIFSEYKHFIDQPYVLADIEKTMYKEKESFQITLVKKIV